MDRLAVVLEMKKYLRMQFPADFEAFQESLDERGSVCFRRNLGGGRNFSYADLTLRPTGDSMASKDHLKHIPIEQRAWFLFSLFYFLNLNESNEHFPKLTGFLGSAGEYINPTMIFCDDVLSSQRLTFDDLVTCLSMFSEAIGDHIKKSKIRFTFDLDFGDQRLNEAARPALEWAMSYKKMIGGRQ